jgi:hypothetical protein
MAFVVYGRDDGRSARGVAKGVPGRQAVEGIGGVCGRADDLAQSQIDFGASGLDGRARGVLEEWRWRGIQLDRPHGRAHHPGIGGRKRHRFLQDSSGGGVGWLADISGRRHGTRCACL